jgi:hypothetical protein
LAWRIDDGVMVAMGEDEASLFIVPGSLIQTESDIVTPRCRKLLVTRRVGRAGGAGEAGVHQLARQAAADDGGVAGVEYRR